MQRALHEHMCVAQSMGSLLQACVNPKDACLHTYLNGFVMQQLLLGKAFAIVEALSLLSRYHYYQ
jgi:hypothetical protein